MKITVGADPEFFLSKNGEFVSAHDLVPGTKDKPFKLKNGAVQVDGTAVEFNIDPACTSDEFCTNIESVLKQIREIVDPCFKFEFKPSVRFEQGYFRRIPLYARRLGCDPDYSSITGAVNPRPKAVGSLRTGAGHIHIGWGTNLDIGDADHLWDCRLVVNTLDRCLGCYQSVWDKDKERKKMYGKKGAFRPKPYGVEYRVPSNAWVKFPGVWPFIHQMVCETMEQLKQGKDVWSVGPVYNIYNAQYLSNRYHSVPFPDELKEMEI